MKKTINVFIPAAGFGERLRPVTLHIPKPLLPVIGKPVLQHILERVLSLPVNKIGINLHHKKEAVREWIDRYSAGTGRRQTLPFVFFEEQEILGTGGALKNAGHFLSEGAFLVHNSDILTDINLDRLLEHHLSSTNLATLAVHDYPKFNNVTVDERGFFRGAGTGPDPAPATGRKVAFTGIAVYEPEFLKFIPPGRSGVVDAWVKAAGSGHAIGTFDVSNYGRGNRTCWSDVGTSDAYAAAVFDMLRADGETVYIHPSTKGCRDIEMKGYVVIEEGCVFEGEGAIHGDLLLENCIMLPGCRAGDILERPLQNCISGPGFKIDLNKSEIPAICIEEGKQLIGSGGSDRKYFRIKRGKETAALMECRRDDADFERQIEFTDFFLKYHIPVPGLLEVDSEEKRAVFEDAGDTSLYNWLKCPREDQEIEGMYRKVIDVLAVFHTSATDHAAECPLLKNRIFDYEYFRWETDYFIERFVEGAGHVDACAAPGLTDELNLLALKADSFSRTIIHRDFQSQNIIVLPDGSLRVLDYQGARMGPPAYDVASILWDPYYRLEDRVRERLTDYYISKIEDKFDVEYFRETLAVCRLQRHMQALGAYGFLSLVKGKKYFMKYAPEGIRLLKEDISFAKDQYPELFKLIMQL